MEKEKENYPHCEVNNNNIQKKDEKSKYIILNNKFFIIDMNPIFPQNNCPPKEPNEETKDASIKEKKEEKSHNQLSLQEGNNLLIEFLQKKRKFDIEELNIKTQNKINKITKEKRELEDESLYFEKKGKELLEKGNQLLEEAERKREIIKMLEEKEETIKNNEKNEKIKIEEKIETEKERGIKRIREKLELSRLANKLESYGVVVDYDIKEFVVGEKSP